MDCVAVCGCYTFDQEFFPNSWMIEVILKRHYNAKVVAEMTYSKRPWFGVVPASEWRKLRSSPYCTQRS